MSDLIYPVIHPGNWEATYARYREIEAERDRLREALHRIHRGDPMPHKIAADALTDIPENKET